MNPPATATRPVLSRRYGNLIWDGVLRGSGLLALAALPASVRWNEAAELTAFVLITIWVNGPISPFLPATYEPVLMLFGRVYSPLLIASLGIAGTIYVEFLNYHLYRTALDAYALGAVKRSRTVAWTARWFARAPFFTIWLCAWSPIPFWVPRFLAPLTGYSIRRYLFATFLGRFPRLWFFAALGLYWSVSPAVLAGIALTSIALALVIWLGKGREPVGPGGVGAEAEEAAG